MKSDYRLSKLSLRSGVTYVVSVVLFIVRQFHDAVRPLQQIENDYTVVCRRRIIHIPHPTPPPSLPENKANLQLLPDTSIREREKS